MAKSEESIVWAEVAIRAAELDARTCTGAERENALLNAVSVRAWFIARIGSRPGHVVLDKEIILRRAESGLTISVQTAGEKAKSFWENLKRAKTSSNPADIQQVAKDARLLRWIKHRIRTVKVLADCEELPIESALREWLPLYESLP